MFIWCDGRPHRVPNERQTFVKHENFDAWCNSDQARRIETWVADNLNPPLGNDEFFPFTSEKDLIESVNNYTIELEENVQEWKDNIQDWMAQGVIS